MCRQGEYRVTKKKKRPKFNPALQHRLPIRGKGFNNLSNVLGVGEDYRVDPDFDAVEDWEVGYVGLQNRQDTE